MNKVKVGKDVYSRYIIKNDVMYREGKCIRFVYRKSEDSLERVVGDILEVGEDTFNGAYIHVKNDKSKGMVLKYYTKYME